MWNRFAAACAFFLLGTFLFGQQPQSGTSQPAAGSQPAMSDAQKDLTNLFETKIKAEWEAIKKKDQKAYGDLLADDFIGVEADREGERYKWKAQAELEFSAVTDYQLSFLKVAAFCPDAAFVRYEVFIKFPPKSVVRFEKILVGEIWVKREGQWKVLHYQETKVK